MKTKRLENTYKYLKRFEKPLLERAALRRYFTRGGKIVAPFYSMFDIGSYTFAPWKVVWREQASEMTAAVVGSIEGRPVIPDHKLMLVECNSRSEGHYLCAVLNSAITRYGVSAYAIEIQMGPHILQNIRVPKLDLKDKLHLELAGLSEQAHKIAAKLERDQAKESSEIKTIEEEVDQCAAKLWGLSDKELKEIKSALEELK
jgi:hypothetical protein